MKKKKESESPSLWWAPVKGYEGLYEVSIEGEVRSLDRWTNGKEKILKPGKDRGYLLVVLCRNGKRKMHSIHRLVAEAFIPNPDNLPQVNHKDENPSNNHVNNLEWVTPKENANWGTCIQRRTEKISKPVVGISPNTGEVVAEFLSTAEAGRNGFKQGAISRCCRGKLKTYKGLIWCFKGISDEEIGRRIAECMSHRRTNGKPSKPVVGINPDTGEVVVEFPSVAEAERNGFNHGHISDCCNGKLKTHRKLVWRYAGDPYIPEHNLVVALDKQGRVVHVFPSTIEAGKHGFNEYAVKCCCEGRRKTHRKLVWLYKKDFLKRVC